MRLSLGLSMQQQQKLIMTPELRQAIAILQLPVTDLREYIDQELLENPVLEVQSADEEGGPAAAEAGENGPANDVETAAAWLDYLGDRDDGRVAARESKPSFEAYTAPVCTLYDHLLDQLRLVSVQGLCRHVAQYLIGNLDEHGYLTLSVAEAARALGVEVDVVESALAVLHTLDPAGVGARNLQECLLLQHAAIGSPDPLVPKIIAEHLDDLADGRITRIAEALGVTPREVQDAVDVIRTLDPKPGRCFGRPGENRYVVADVVVERVGGDYVVIVNDAPVPRLFVSPYYRRVMAAKNGLEQDVRRFLEQKLHSALWLMRSIEQRRLTLYRVTEAIVRLQRAFFDQGVRHMRPLTLREVAEVIGMHESTVSRATAGKYVQTPRGLFELKFFFSSGVESARGPGVASEGVKKLMRDLIDAEEAANPLSDQQLAEALSRQGIVISRRTVAKYREEMGVASSARRRRY